MQNLYSHNYLGNQHADDFFLERKIFSLQVEVYITPWQILHDDVDLVFILVLKGLADGDEELVDADLSDELALEDVKFLDFSLVDDLHGVLIMVFLILGEDDIAESTPAQILDALVTICSLSNKKGL